MECHSLGDIFSHPFRQTNKPEKCFRSRATRSNKKTHKKQFFFFFWLTIDVGLVFKRSNACTLLIYLSLKWKEVCAFCLWVSLRRQMKRSHAFMYFDILMIIKTFLTQLYASFLQLSSSFGNPLEQSSRDLL